MGVSQNLNWLDSHRWAGKAFDGQWSTGLSSVRDVTEPATGQVLSKVGIANAADMRAEGMGCNCDLDNWEPEQSTGHSHVCRIHKAALQRYRKETA